MLTTTLNRIRAAGPCLEGWEKLLASLGKSKADDDPLPFAVIAKSNGLDDALWAAQCEPQHYKTWRLFAVWCGRQALHLMTDQRSRDALDVAERHANGLATDEELAAARAAASDAARAAAADAASAAADAAWAASAAARGAAWAAWAASDAARAAAWAAWAASAARAAASDAARDAARAAAAAAAMATADAANAASDAASDAARVTQLAKFIEMVTAAENAL